MPDEWDIEVMPDQRALIQCVAPRMCFMAGRRYGKTFAFATKMKMDSIAHDGMRIMYISPLAAQGLDVFKQMVADRYFYEHLMYNQKRPYPLLVLKNGAQILFRSFQRPDNIRSTGEDQVYPDEIQDARYTEWEINTNILPLLADRDYPITNDGTRGRLIIGGQFRGDNHIYKKFWLPGQRVIDGKPNPLFNPRYASWAIPTSAGHNFQTLGGVLELQEIQNSTPPLEWEQEYLCKPCANRFAAFPRDEVDACVGEWQIGLADWQRRPLAVYREPIPGEAYVVCVDMGRKLDPTAVIVGDTRGNIVFEQIYPLGQLHEISARNAALTAARYSVDGKPADMVVDVTGGGNPGQPGPQQDAFVKFYREHSDKYKIQMHAVYQNQQNKNKMVEALALAIQTKRLAIPKECVNVLAQLKAYEYRPNKRDDKIMGYGGPVGTKDDLVSSAYMYIEALTRGWFRSANASGSVGYM